MGKLSSKYETSGRGPGTVSSGKEDEGGVSYGSYQLASRKGSVAKFLAGEGAKWAYEFKGLDPTVAGGQFTKKWKEIAARSPIEFDDAQHQFIQRTHYAPVIAAVKKRTGLELSEHSNAVKDVVWSTAVQHGGAQHIIAAGVRSVSLKASDPQFDHALINAIYRSRSNYVAGLKNMSPVRKNREIARYRKERMDALKALNGD
ncbi:hypothetical protein [Noviherbaspirillum sp. Root189]|uniref:VgrG-related protein n=1 Tax=Noviherbaspirillum sp. Root189 TaxID=1736487 RepID=UPI002E0F9993